MARLVLIYHFLIFCVACGSARVVCGGKIARAETAVTLVYRFSCLLWHLELRKKSFQRFITEYSYSALASQISFSIAKVFKYNTASIFSVTK